MTWLKVSFCTLHNAKVALLNHHYYAEISKSAAIVGDIAPGDGVSKEEKCRRETEAIGEIRSLIGTDNAAGKETSCRTCTESRSILSFALVLYLKIRLNGFICPL